MLVYITVAYCTNRTDYIDLCGEPEFMQRSTLKFHEAAKAKGVLIMHACAFGEQGAQKNSGAVTRHQVLLFVVS